MRPKVQTKSRITKLQNSSETRNKTSHSTKLTKIKRDRLVIQNLDKYINEEE